MFPMAVGSLSGGVHCICWLVPVSSRLVSAHYWLLVCQGVHVHRLIVFVDLDPFLRSCQWVFKCSLAQADFVRGYTCMSYYVS